MELPHSLHRHFIERGSILHSEIFEDIDHGKFFAVMGVSEDMLVGFFFINSRIHPAIQKRPAQFAMQYLLRKKDYDFLRYDSFLSATAIIKLPINRLSETIVSPLGVKDRLGDLIAIRHPMFANEDLSMNVGANLAEGTAVIRMEATIDELISSVKTTLSELKQRFGKKAAFYHLIHCGGRRAGIGDRVNEIYEAIKSEIDGTPFIMEFTFGEYGYEDDGRNTTGGLMLSFTVFGE